MRSKKEWNQVPLPIFSGISYWSFYIVTCLRSMTIRSSRTVGNTEEPAAQNWMLGVEITDVFSLNFIPQEVVPSQFLGLVLLSFQ